MINFSSRVSYNQYEKDNRMKKKLIILLFFLFAFNIVYSQNCSGAYKIVATCNSCTDNCQISGPYSIFLVTTKLYGIRTVSLVTYNPMERVWNNTLVQYVYHRQADNWRVYRYDCPVLGTSLLYINEDGSKVRLENFLRTGKTHEFVRCDSGEEYSDNPVDYRMLIVHPL